MGPLIERDELRAMQRRQTNHLIRTRGRPTYSENSQGLYLYAGRVRVQNLVVEGCPGADKASSRRKVRPREPQALRAKRGEQRLGA